MKDKKYVKFRYTLDLPYCNFDEFELIPIEDDTYFSEILFEKGFITLYLKDDFVLSENKSKNEIENYAENKAFSIFLEIVKNSDAKNFKLYKDESYIDCSKKSCLETECSLGMSTSIKCETHGSDGTIITEDENKQMILESNKKKMQDIISNSNDNMNIQEKDKEKFIKLFQVKNPVIRYFILYSWLVDFFPNSKDFGSQKEAKKFIRNSKIFNDMGKIEKQRLDDGGTDVTEDIFTHLRNLIGHSINDILTINDELIIQDIIQYTNPLIKIILEKLNSKI